MRLSSSEVWRVKGMRRAFILLSVSWIVLILSLLLLSQLKRLELVFESYRCAKIDFQLRLAAKSALHQVLAGMGQEMREGGDKYDAYSDKWGWSSLMEVFGEDLCSEYPGVQLSVAIEDEDSKINLRTASLASVENLLEVLGWSTIQAKDTALAIQELTRQVERGIALSGGNDDSPHSNAVEILDMCYLLNISGITPEVLYGEDINFNLELDLNENDGLVSFPMDDRNGVLGNGLTRFVTLRGSGDINPNLAPYEVLLTVPGVSKAIAEEIVLKRVGGDNIAGTEDDFVFSRQEDLLELSFVSRFQEFEYQKMTAQMHMTSQLFTLRICAVSDNTDQLFRIQTCIKRSQDGQVHTLTWLEDNGV